ncbi:hypothetical protein [Actinocorallia herbida]|uniref:hypothetical protein n=1 Tax=Actinocorallia herbida TaxID=58109 RepID=UPI001476B9D5|nr:hypothetical protein [Actinocorallia herbida]
MRAAHEVGHRARVTRALRMRLPTGTSATIAKPESPCTRRTSGGRPAGRRGNVG